MATIVQPYNPWREQLALTALGNVAGDIIGDIWKTHKQNEQNRKANAFRGQLQQELGNIAQQGNISLAQPQAPEGYNSNPWASALHQSYTPLTQFDIGTSKRQPTIQDIANIADNLAATPRFSALSPEVLQGVKNSMMKNAVSAMFGNAGNWGDKINALGLGVTNGVVPYQAMTALSQLYVHDNPHYDFNDVNIGTHNLTVARNPKDGTASPVLISPIGMSEYQRASLQNQKDIANIGANTSMYGDDLRYKTDSERNAILRDQQEYEQKYPERTTHTDREGRVVTINRRTGRAETVLDEDMQPIFDNPPPKDLGDRDRALLKSLEDKRKILIDRFNNLSKWRDPGEPMSAEETDLYSQIEECNRQIDKIINPPQPKPKPAQPTVAEVPMRGNATPITTQRTDQSKPPVVTAVRAESADVTPTLPPQASTDQNFSDFRPSYIGDLQPITALSTAPQAQAQSVQPQAKKKGTVRVPTTALYDPSRDRNVSADMIKSLNDLYSDYNKYKNQLQLPSTFEEFLNNCIRDGVKIDQRTRK
ncbi:MAG: hypothetical protein IJQ08_01555 [Synergistaceae bacterium]|nr:hypothetical protein [Synergistaceae bacterium]